MLVSPASDFVRQHPAGLNLAVAEWIDNGEEVTAPGTPTSYPDPNKLISSDGISPV